MTHHITTARDYTTHPEYLALLRGILDNPDDDAPRWIIADWIQDARDDERAEFIRLMLADPTHSLVYDGGGTSPVSQLLHRHGHAWLGEWYGEDGTGIGRKFWWNRGFVSEIRLPCGAFMAPGPTCHKCFGEGDGVDESGCRLCGSSGTLPGLARRLFREHPIISVVLTDAEPLSNTGYTDDGRPDAWFWLRQTPGTRMFWEVPPEIMPASSSDHASEEAAYAALSKWCVSYGRSLAGLPPLGRRERERVRG